MAIDYPADLPLPLASKRAGAVPGFSMAQPRRGTPFAQPRATIPPTVYEVEWLLQAHEAAAFRDWVFVTLQQGSLAFRLPLRTEYGLEVLLCLFAPDGLLDRQRLGTLWRYRATIIAGVSVIAPPTVVASGLPASCGAIGLAASVSEVPGDTFIFGGVGAASASGVAAAISVASADPDPLYGFVTHLYSFDNGESEAGPFINSIAGGPSATRSGGVAALLPTANLISGSARAIRATARSSGDGLQLIISRSTTALRQPWCVDAQVRRLADVGFEGSWEYGGILQFTNFAFFVRGAGGDGGSGPTGTAWQARLSLGGVTQVRGTRVLQVGVRSHVALSWTPVGTTQGRWRCFIDGELDFDITRDGDNNIGGLTTVRIGPTSSSIGFGTLPFELDCWRLTIGSARYTEPFTPPNNAANYLPP